MHPGAGFALFSHDFFGAEVEGVHFEFVVFGEEDGVVQFAGFDAAFAEVHFRPDDFLEPSTVFAHSGAAVVGQFYRFAPAVGVDGDEGSDEFHILLDLDFPFCFVFGAKHFRDVWR